ncbi:MAG: 30S ribosomal protein S20 [Patescibacteria group bacterium]|nr:30S ribosomal protein S20 [Patescibacteria group bacterium]
MPITKQAIKKTKRDQKARERNQEKRDLVKNTIKLYRKSPTQQLLQKVFSLIDKGVKYGILKKNKSSRLKSRLSKITIKK